MMLRPRSQHSYTHTRTHTQTKDSLQRARGAQPENCRTRRRFSHKRAAPLDARLTRGRLHHSNENTTCMHMCRKLVSSSAGGVRSSLRCVRAPRIHRCMRRGRHARVASTFCLHTRIYLHTIWVHNWVQRQTMLVTHFYHTWAGGGVAPAVPRRRDQKLNTPV